tara:strand:- start:4753 stop:4875 length:123 start_codon:yes stop_codon:yes gene_type:complete
MYGLKGAPYTLLLLFYAGFERQNIACFLDLACGFNNDIAI